MNVIKTTSLFLSERAEILYLAPILPMFMSLGISLATAAIYTLNGAEYSLCKIAHKEEYLDRYLSGSIIINYIFLLIFINILMELISFLSNILMNFISLLLYCIMSIIWHALGISWLGGSKCSESKYYKIAFANIIIGFVGIFIYLFLVILKIMLSKNQKIQPINEGQNNAQNEGNLVSNEVKLDKEIKEEEGNLNEMENKMEEIEKPNDLDELLKEIK